MNALSGLGNDFYKVENACSEKIAIITESCSYTYSALLSRAKELSVFMHGEGVNHGDVVAIASEKTFDDYAVMLACLMSGVVYLNINIEDPVERIKSILRQCDVKLVFCNKRKLKIPFSQVFFENIKSDGAYFKKTCFDGESIAYIMFTSGSTGQPKGASVTHNNIREFVAWSTNRYCVSPEDNFAQLSPLYFDNSVFDFYTSIFNGASITAVSKELLSNPKGLVDYVDTKKCTIWFSVPSLFIYLNVMRVFRSDVLQKIRIFSFGGEGFPKSELKKIYDIYGGAEFINVYGPTECTCICSSYTVTDDDFLDLEGIPPIGFLNGNFEGVVLGREESEDKGELCLLGPCVGKGYFSNNSLTKERFGIFEGGKHRGKRYYNTGDLVKVVGGKYYFVGRSDNQIKHMGYRIELEEIEFSINGFSNISRSVVLYKRVNKLYGNIVAFIVLDLFYDDFELDGLREYLAMRLPAYMLPSKYVFLESFEKNSNGKIDRSILEGML